jgi:tRNA threonylcarbamoyladenosine biosynthesis protein TsaE
VEGNVSSPTFVIARTHKREGKAPLVHVDAYRLGSPQQLDDLDIPFASSIVLVEWGKGLTDEISEHWLEIEISRDTTGSSEDRQVMITGFGERWARVSI